MASLANMKVVVIGGSSGIGFAVAKAVLAEGGSVVISSSSGTKVSAAVQRLDGGARVTGEAFDVSDEAAIKAFFEKTGKFEHLVFTAGDIFNPAFIGADLSSSKKALDVRFWGLLLCAQHSRAYLSGSIVATSGTVGQRPIAGFALGAGVSGAVDSSTRNLALDLAPVRVNCVVVGAIKTELWDWLGKEAIDNFEAKVASTLPVKRVGRPEEAAEAFIFAMKCTYLTGQTIVVDGGSTLV